MVSFFILILCLNIDALSYGIAYGAIKKKFKIKYVLAITILSTLMFAIPLAGSKYIYSLFNPLVLRIINGIILILLGFSYFLKKEENKKNIEINEKISFKQYFLECLAISIDAIFTAILSGFSANYYIFAVFFYAFSNFFAIFLGNYIFYNFNKKSKLKLNIFSGFIFIFLGIIKMIGS